MPKFKVRTPITHGVRNDKGEVELKEYAAGDTIELTKEEAGVISHAVEKGPSGLESMPKDVQEAVQSILDKPEHKDSGVQADWKVDEFAKSNAVGVRQASRVGVETGPIPASSIAPGEEVHHGVKQEAPKGSDVAEESANKAKPAGK